MTKYIISLSLILVLTKCRDLIDVEPPINELVTETVFSDPLTANAAAAGIYSEIVTPASFMGTTLNGIRNFTAESADEFNPFSGSYHREFYQNEITPSNSIVSSIWNTSYRTIYGTNAMIEGLQQSASLATVIKNQFEGEALFIRAFLYFYLTNFFGDVPLVTSTDYASNRVLYRAKTTEIYERIKDDLQKAKELLASDYSYSSGERVRANDAAATALLARVFLYQGLWEQAEIEATNVINNPLYQLESLDKVFLSSSKEAIWQLKPTAQTRYNAAEAFYLFTSPTFGAFTSQLANSFELNDNRKSFWTVTVGAYTYPRKYKSTASSPPNTEYSIVLRLAEQYLIRAEARAQQGNFVGARNDINTIRFRAGLPDISANTKTEILEAIEQERRIELFTEYGHRWFDLKRWGKANEVLGATKPFWDNTDVLYPIPEGELLRAPNLIQNPGY